ncbi:MAG TPA: Hsp20/alpha crystallin family protein [Thermoanaerobaculia bacterium]
MAIVRRNDPFRDLFSLQDQLFRTFGDAYRGREEESVGAPWSPLVDVFEDAEGITLKAELPGLDGKDVEIQVEGNTLTLKGERRLENEEKRDGYHRIERTYGAFSRTFTLPNTVDAEHITAESKDGVLGVFLPKKAETKPRQIKVAVSQPGTQSAPGKH